MTNCSHHVKHKEVLGHTLCVCCSHCQEELSKIKKLARELLETLKNYPKHISNYTEGEIRLAIVKAEQILGKKK